MEARGISTYLGEACGLSFILLTFAALRPSGAMSPRGRQARDVAQLVARFVAFRQPLLIGGVFTEVAAVSVLVEG